MLQVNFSALCGCGSKETFPIFFSRIDVAKLRDKLRSVTAL